MAKDDYHVIVYRVLAYYYAVMKRKILFEKTTFDVAVKKHIENEEYFVEVLRMMQDDGLIQGLAFVNAWGGDGFLSSDPEDAKITAKGIHYLEENETMKKVGQKLKEAVDTIAKLAMIIGILA